MNQVVYVKYELLRTLRNRRYLIFSLGFPLVLFLVIAGSNKNNHVDGIPLVLYFMTGMAAWGSMNAVVSVAGRIASERQAGWIRQLKVTPLPIRVYFRAKALSSYLMAVLSIAALYIAGVAMGVHLGGGQWGSMTLLLLVGLIPFVVLGIMMGHFFTVDTLGPAMGGITALMALLGGAWGPLASKGALFDISKALPSYWLVQAGKSALTHQGWPVQGWVVLAVWTGLFGWAAVFVYRRDTGRVS